jgi:hypothetical protein
MTIKFYATVIFALVSWPSLTLSQQATQPVSTTELIIQLENTAYFAITYTGLLQRVVQECAYDKSEATIKKAKTLITTLDGQLRSLVNAPREPTNLEKLLERTQMSISSIDLLLNSTPWSKDQKIANEKALCSSYGDYFQNRCVDVRTEQLLVFDLAFVSNGSLCSLGLSQDQVNPLISTTTNEVLSVAIINDFLKIVFGKPLNERSLKIARSQPMAGPAWSPPLVYSSIGTGSSFDGEIKPTLTYRPSRTGTPLDSNIISNRGSSVSSLVGQILSLLKQRSAVVGSSHPSSG